MITKPTPPVRTSADELFSGNDDEGQVAWCDLAFVEWYAIRDSNPEPAD
jgi:hypothetical protein